LSTKGNYALIDGHLVGDAVPCCAKRLLVIAHDVLRTIRISCSALVAQHDSSLRNSVVIALELRQLFGYVILQGVISIETAGRDLHLHGYLLDAYYASSPSLGADIGSALTPFYSLGRILS